MQAMQSMVLDIVKRCTDIQDKVGRMQWILCEMQLPSGPCATPSFKNNAYCTPHDEPHQNVGKTDAPLTREKRCSMPMMVTTALTHTFTSWGEAILNLLTIPLLPAIYEA